MKASACYTLTPDPVKLWITASQPSGAQEGALWAKQHEWQHISLLILAFYVSSKPGVSKDVNTASFMSDALHGAGKGKALQVKPVAMGATDVSHCIELPAPRGIA